MSTATQKSIPTYGEVLGIIQERVNSNSYVSANISKDNTFKIIQNHKYVFSTHAIHDYTRICFAFEYNSSAPLLFSPIYNFDYKIDIIYTFSIKRNPNSIMNMSLLINVIVLSKNIESNGFICEVDFTKLADDKYFSDADRDVLLQAVLMR